MQKSLQERAFWYNHKAEPHLQLANLYLQQNNFELAEKEIKVALQSSNNTNLITEQEKINEVKKDYQKTLDKIDYLEKLVYSHPNYRDAWLQLASHYYRIYRPAEAISALENAYLLDPNEPNVKYIRKIFPWITD